MFSPAIPQVMADFGVTSDVLGSFSVSMFIFGYAIGPLCVSLRIISDKGFWHRYLNYMVGR